MGRHLQQAAGQVPQVIMTVPILEGLDGVNKMSKSLGNTIGLNDAPDDMFGKVMSVSDSLMWRYFDLLSFRPLQEIAELRGQADAGQNPRDIKMTLAREIVGRFHGTAMGQQANDAFIARFSEGRLPDDIQTVQASCGADGLSLAKALKEAGLAASNAEGARLIGQRAVRLDGERVDDRALMLAAGNTYLLQVGSRRNARLALTAASTS